MASETTTTTTSTVEAAPKGGLPQFDFAYWPGQIVWLLITFAVVYAVLSRSLLPKVRGGVDERNAKIDGDLAEARRLRDEAEAQAAASRADMAEARAQAQRTAAEAKGRGQAESARRNAALEAELNTRLHEAEARIGAARDQAMGQVRGVAAETAAAITARLTGAAATPEEIDAAFAGLAAR